MLKNIMGQAKELLIVFVCALAISLLVKGLLIDNRLIPTSSMVPTVPVDSRLLVNRVVYYGNDPEFLDIVVFEPNDSTKAAVGRNDDMLKRVIGVPGDVILIADGVLYRNGDAVDEPYISDVMDYEYGPVTVPEDCVFLLGDNRNYSYDAHLWEDPFVPIDQVKGKAFFMYWPLSSFGSLS